MVEVIELTDPSADAHIARHFGRTPILVQLPTALTHTIVLGLVVRDGLAHLVSLGEY